jgi:large subunit ribosomal protein L18
VNERFKQRKRRQRRIRSKIYGTPQRPRLCVYKSLKHIYAQVVDDTAGVTLAAASTLDREFNGTGRCNIKSAERVGKLIAKRAKVVGIKKVAFDRSGYPFHGIVKALAEGSRGEGLEF